MSAAIPILCVDDEPRVLSGVERTLRKTCTVMTAPDAAAGLERLEREGPFSVVLSDMRMPGMNGAEFLARVRDMAPESTRMLLTGHSDIQSAIAAVNDGQIFRFLTKPCPPERLIQAVVAGMEQYDLIRSEKVLLEQTLRGSIRALSDILALSNPTVFGRSNRVRQTVCDVASQIGVADTWSIEVAAMLEPLGIITLSPDLVEKLDRPSIPLTPGESGQVAEVPRISAQILGRIPRLEPVLEILNGVCPSPLYRPESVPIGSRILRVASAFDAFRSRGYTASLAIDELRRDGHGYDAGVLDALEGVVEAAGDEDVMTIPICDIEVGMIFADDVRLPNGALFVARGYEVTRGLVERARNLKKGAVSGPVRVVGARAAA